LLKLETSYFVQLSPYRNSFIDSYFRYAEATPPCLCHCLSLHLVCHSAHARWFPLITWWYYHAPSPGI